MGSKKAASNLRKHHVSFDDGVTLFEDQDELMLPDPDHSCEEERFISIGKVSAGRIKVASYTEVGRVVRLISLRPATAKEVRMYERRGG